MFFPTQKRFQNQLSHPSLSHGNVFVCQQHVPSALHMLDGGFKITAVRLRTQNKLSMGQVLDDFNSSCPGPESPMLSSARDSCCDPLPNESPLWGVLMGLRGLLPPELYGREV